MPKPPSGGGGGGGSSLFTSNISGPPPGPTTIGANTWINLGSVPTGFRIKFGTGQYASPDKASTFEIRTNNTGASAGTDAATALLASISASPRSGTVTADYYKSGTLNTVTVLGTGVERFWLRIKSKSSTAGSYFFSINYTSV